MAEEFKDPRDVPWHPRRTVNLAGHAEAEARLLQAHQSGKLHHAWLMSGPRGIGKATLAYRFARFLLNVPSPERARAYSTLHVAPEASAFRQVAAGAHPGLLVVERAADQKAKRLKTEIAADDAREAQSFLGLVGYYRKYIPGYAQLKTPIRDAIEAGKPARRCCGHGNARPRA
jgi:DNA polymerase-3 subunit delta'